jgi:hypothetical protein
MTNDEFLNMIKSRDEKRDKTLVVKGSEYGQDDDRLRDFYLIAKIANVEVGIVWRVLNAKHLASIYNMFDKKLPNTLQMRDEKCGDEINYGYLGEALLNEES